MPLPERFSTADNRPFPASDNGKPPLGPFFVVISMLRFAPERGQSLLSTGSSSLRNEDFYEYSLFPETQGRTRSRLRR